MVRSSTTGLPALHKKQKTGNLLFRDSLRLIRPQPQSGIMLILVLLHTPTQSKPVPSLLHVTVALAPLVGNQMKALTMKAAQ